ncbi:hypothetical protein ACTODO_00512 [Schaalia dentiphila ATCC 17982]|nr:hypothetical protein ACTODO_00512 [Schaalia odontolytica ATCC 17982]
MRLRIWLIPAHAGKTPSWWTRRGAPPAHPRSRGENGLTALLTIPLSGSSPLTRGKRYTDITGIQRAGLIPAHAGKTTINGRRTLVTEGSSPLTRGKQGARPVNQGHAGLIPAHAGKTGM